MRWWICSATASPRFRRTSCSKATANQFRLRVHTAAYWLLHTLKGLATKTSFWHDAQFDSGCWAGGFRFQVQRQLA
jgi:hypothetical protein